MVDSLRHQRAGPVAQANVDDFGRACDHRGNFAFDRPIIAALNDAKMFNRHVPGDI
jgi:hypothetical protein